MAQEAPQYATGIRPRPFTPEITIIQCCQRARAQQFTAGQDPFHAKHVARGKAASVSAEEVLRELGGKVDAVLDGGRAGIGIESTVVDLTVSPPKILREGAIKKKEIMRILAFSG